MSRVALLTGARGLVGRHAIDALAERGFEVHAVSRGAVSGDGVEGVHWHRADLTDAGAARALLRRVRPTHLLHLAWFVEHGEFWTSPENERWRAASLALLDAFEGERVVGAGTCAEYDWGGAGALDELGSVVRPASPYAIAKDALRREASELLAPRGASFAWGRIFFLHGPGEHPDRLVPSVARALLAGEPARCTEGRQVRDYLYAGDAGRAFVALLDSDVAGPVNVASGVGVPIAELVGWIGAALGRPELIELGALPTRPGEPDAIVARVARLHDEVGFTPAFSPREAIEQTVAWWARQGAARASLPDGA